MKKKKRKKEIKNSEQKKEKRKAWLEEREKIKEWGEGKKVILIVLAFVLFAFIFNDEDYRKDLAKDDMLENCTDARYIYDFYKYHWEGAEKLDLKYWHWKNSQKGDINSIIAKYKTYNSVMPTLIGEQKKFIKRGLKYKLQYWDDRYKKYFLGCEKEMNQAEISFKEKWKKQTKLKFPPYKLEILALDELIKKREN